MLARRRAARPSDSENPVVYRIWRRRRAHEHACNLELILLAANTDRIGLALDEFARWADLRGTELLVVLVDIAGWHVAERSRTPKPSRSAPPAPA